MYGAHASRAAVNGPVAAVLNGWGRIIRRWAGCYRAFLLRPFPRLR